MANDDDLIGKVKEKVGWLTGDREAEAKGKLRRLEATDDAEDGDGDQAVDTVKEAEKDVRSDYGEYDPDVDGATPATDIRPGD